MLEIEPAGQCGRNGSEAMTGAASEAFVMWLHHLCVSSWRDHIILPCGDINETCVWSTFWQLPTGLA